MSHSLEDLEEESDLKSPREQGFFDKSFVIRLLVLLAFSLSIFLFLHFRDVRVEVLELGNRAPNFVVSQVDFDFFDEQATIILKQEAVKDIDKIYGLSPKEIHHTRSELENRLIYSDSWRKEIQNVSFDEMYTALESLDKGLSGLRFTDPRTLKKMQDLRIATPNFQVLTPQEQEQVMLPSSIWDNLKTLTLVDKALSKEAVTFLTQKLSEKPWNLVEETNLQRQIRKKIQSWVPDKYTHVTAGDRIIDQGEKVTARHIAMQQAMKRALSDQRNLWHPATVLGSLLLTGLFVGLAAFYFHHYHPYVLRSNRKLSLIVTIFILTLGLSKATEFFLLTSNHNLIDSVRYPIFVPFAAILLCSLIRSGIAIFISAFLTLLMTLTLAFDSQEFMVVNLTGAIVAVLNTSTLKRRKDIFIVCLKAWGACALVIISLSLYREAQFSASNFIDLASAAGFLLLTGVLVVGLLPLLETAFRIMTDVTLMEYMDPNNDILRRLTIEAPGTYQHSVVVGNLAEAAAISIGANGLFCRVATLYHDIGKMTNPQYFTENQQGDVDIHKLLTPKESAQVIMDHVPEGVAIARKSDLPEQFIDIIKEHHGTTLVYYFYRKELERVEGDLSKIDEKDFRYAGPTPRSRESSIIMIADSFEAASRSLEVVNQETLSELLNRLVGNKAEDGQFEHSLMTFEEMALVKATLVKTLLAFTHSRVKYPKQEPKKSSYPAAEA